MTAWDAHLEAPLHAALESFGQVQLIPKGSILFRAGELCRQFPIVQAGAIEVVRTTGAGREILLYLVGLGQSCILSTACLLADERYAADGIAETAVTAVGLSAGSFEWLIASNAGFRRLVFARYAERIAALMARIETLLDKPLGVRLAACLIDHAGGDAAIHITHHELAPIMAQHGRW